MKKIIIAIDGYAGCGKSTTAKIVAEKLNYTYLDSGAMYRAVTLYFLQNQVNWEDTEQVNSALRNIEILFTYNPHTHKSETCLNGVNVEGEIRKMYISEKVSEISKIAEVRHAMVAQQQKLGEKKGIVMDGRDIGTKVFPEAELKIFMTADIQVRARRRMAELEERGQLANLDKIIENLKHRDLVDTTRKESPLMKAEDALLLDSTEISISQQTEYVLEMAQNLTLVAN